MKKKSIFISPNVRVTFENIYPDFCAPEKIARTEEIVEIFRIFNFWDFRGMAFEIIRKIPGLEICKIMKK